MSALVPPPVRQLLRRHVDSVGALELLLLLRSAHGRPITLEHICAVLHCPRGWAAARLAAFRDAGLAHEQDDGWRFAPATAELDDVTAALEEANLRHPAAVARFIFAGTRRAS